MTAPRRNPHGRRGFPVAQERLPFDPEPLRADCRLCGESAVPGLRLCRTCWGYQLTLATARFMLNESERAA